MTTKSLPYFSKLPLGSQHAVRDVLRDSNHRFYGDLMDDIRSISNETLEQFVKEYRIERFVFRETNKDLAKRVWYIEYHLAEEIAKMRIKELHDNSQNPKPYHINEMNGLEIDKNYLVPLKSLKLYNSGLLYKDQIYQICPSLHQPNSSHWLSNLIIEETFKKGRNFNVRLDPLVVIPKDEYQPYFQLMEVYGRKLDWERLKTLKGEEFGQWLGDELSTRSILFTDFVWSSSATEVHFTCEELPKENYLELRGSRYFHAIFDKASGNIIHCDGALRFYSNDEYNYRLNYHVRQPEVRKIGKRIKLFQLDEEIDQNLFMKLATNFLVWNEDALNYFN